MAEPEQRTTPDRPPRTGHRRASEPIQDPSARPWESGGPGVWRIPDPMANLGWRVLRRLSNIEALLAELVEMARPARLKLPGEVKAEDPAEADEEGWPTHFCVACWAHADGCDWPSDHSARWILVVPFARQQAADRLVHLVQLAYGEAKGRPPTASEMRAATQAWIDGRYEDVR